MIIISYDISDTKLRTKFSKFLMKSGGIRLQYSVYEFNNTNRMIENVKEKIRIHYCPLFCNDDSVVLFTATKENVEKYGNAIHREDRKSVV